jgi:HSP20 family protein
MNMRDLIPWTRSQDSLPDLFRDERTSPFLILHREMNRLLDEAFRGFAPAERFCEPRVAEARSCRNRQANYRLRRNPRHEEKDVELLFDDGNLIVRGEMKSETEDKERQFSERFCGRFERRIPVDMGIKDSKIEASFKNGVLKVPLPKTERAQTKAKRIAIKTLTKHCRLLVKA